MTFPILGGNGAVAGYSIDNSLRFNDNDSARLENTFGSAGDRTAWTWSGWVKIGNLSTAKTLFGAHSSGSYLTFLQLTSSNEIRYYDDIGASNKDIKTNRLFRDTSAFYHIVLQYDSDNATSSDRIKIYINGERETSFATSSYPSSGEESRINSAITHRIGSHESASYMDGYMAEINFIDGQALSPTDFGEFDEDSGIWKPIQYTGSYGTNGFYLDFENSGSLGADQSGNGNNFTPTNLASTDQTTDTPTNNFSTLNALRFSSSPTYSEGNLKAVTTSEAGYVSSSIAVKTGKWYWETRFSSIVTSVMVGVQNVDIPQNTTFYQSGRFSYGSTGSLYYDSASESLATYTTGDIIGIALDMNGDSISWYKNNTLVTTKTLSSYTIDTSKEVEHFIMSGSSGGSAGLTVSVNYGQNGSFNGTETAQGNSDGNGYGDFYYAPPSGYLALCTQNLATALSPTIDDGSAYFHTQLYTGDGSSSNAITNDANAGDFQPDWLWIKERSSTSAHLLFDSTRGTNKKLSSNATDSEETFAYLSSYDTDGFTIGTSDGAINENSQTYVAWQWKASGGSTSSNTSGSITSTVQTGGGGFSIVTFTGTGSSSATVGHGLGKAPSTVIIKSRDATYGWIVWHQNLTTNYNLRLDQTDAEYNPSSKVHGGIGTPSSTVLNWVNGTSGVNNVNRSGDTYVAYCFAEIEGYSKFGSYTGNGSSDGTFVYTGFRPAFVICKRTNGIGSWVVQDNKRPTYNQGGNYVYANSSNAEATDLPIDILSNGFKQRQGAYSDNNGNGDTYIYACFSANPFVSSSGVPVTAR